ncbi:MAG: hypothetical protein KGJ78_04070 [Alphaproteobacteria bacterium]|nr:hypothetical protein [Alphaproteobacteria bacterium]
MRGPDPAGGPAAAPSAGFAGGAALLQIAAALFSTGLEYDVGRPYLWHMAYLIEYYKEGVKAGDTPWNGTFEETKKVARDGLIRHDCDFARIIDVDGSGAEIWSERRDA